MGTIGNWRIGVRLGAAFALVLAMVVAIGAVATIGASMLRAEIERMVEDNVRPLDEISDMVALNQRNRVLLMDMLLRPEPANVERRDTELRANLDKAGKILESYRAHGLDADERKALDAVIAARDPYVRDGLLVTRDLLRAGKVDEARRAYVDRVSPLAPPVSTALDALSNLVVQKAEAAAGLAKTHAGSVALLAAALAAGALALGTVLAWWITRSITVPLAMAIGVARRVTTGDLTGTIDAASKDEVGQLLGAMRGMQSSLVSLVSQVRGNAESVATAGSQIAQGNADLSSRTERQASALQQTSATMSELSDNVRHNADNARQASQLAQSASDVAQRGGAVVGEVVETMKGIHEASRRIAEIIGTIDGIAFQTNILALNAAVEAARAGEQGRGFAVVAGEVRALAQRAGEAAREIRSLIGASVERVEAGSALVGRAGVTMSDVVSAVRRVSDIVGEISSASGEQAVGVTQIGQAVAQLDQVTQQNSALVEESAAAAESLKQQAGQLVGAVAVFRVPGLA